MVTIPFPFDPDWTNGITERLSWLTAIQTSRTGAEQRQALRVAPRRQIDIPLVLHGGARSYFDTLLARQGGSTWYAPIPHEQIFYGYVYPGQTAFAFDTTYREIRVGSNLMVRGDTFHVEMIQVTSVSADGIVTTPTVYEYAAARITPTFQAVIAEKVSASRQNARTMTATVRFSSVEPMVWPTTARSLAAFGATYQTASGKPAYPILTKEPNSVNVLDYEFERMWSSVDNSMSVPLYIDKAGREFTSQQYAWFLNGPQERRDFRDLLFALQGRAKPLWVPTFNDDFSTTLGYENVMGFPTTPIPDREYGAQFTRAGVVTGFAASAYNTGTRIPPETFADATILRRSFMSLKRLDVDDIEFLHYADLDGVATVTALFRDAPDIRQPLNFAVQGFPNSGYWPGAADTGTRAPATNASTGLTDVLTITGPAGGGT